jgi:hypothetical protein
VTIANTATKVTAVKVGPQDDPTLWNVRGRTSDVVQCDGCGVWLEGSFLFCESCSALKMQDKPLPSEVRTGQLLDYIMQALA